MALLHNDIYDYGLDGLAGPNRVLHILSQEPATLGDVPTYTLGQKIAPTIGSPVDRTGGGREVIITAVADGNVSDTGTATHWAIVDATEGTERLLAANNLSLSQGVTDGTEFTLTEFTVGMPAPI